MSKELKALEELFDAIVDEYSGCEIMIKFQKDKNIIETALKENQDIQSCFEDYGLSIKDIRKVCVSYKQREKHEKALEIIKEKHVDCFKLIAIFRTSNNLEHYNQNYGCDWQLTQEEYNLLKEVLL